MKRFLIRLKKAHDDTGYSPYRVFKETGIAQNTVKKYVEFDEVVADYLAPAVVELADFYGLDWRDPAVIEVIEDDDPETESPLNAIA